MAVAGLLGVSIIAGSALALNGSLPNLFAETADSGGPLKADPVTLGSWTDLEDGEVWTDKSVYTDTLTLSDNEESIKLTPDEGNFGVGLSVLTAGGKSAVDGDVIFTEPLGRFMEVKEIDGLFYRDSYHTVDEFIAYFERASGEDRAKIEQLVSSRIQGIDGGELIDKAIEAGSFTHDANWIDWYENAQGTYVDDVR
ncbi:MAG: hypothetical protein HDQ88_05865, partial [Clostridia bacterium]|nr:hypothetical protein [Clostridia bacterium]